MTEDFDPNSHDSLYASIPTQLREGTTMLKVSAKKVQRRLVKLKAEAGQLLWESKHAGMRAFVPALRCSLFAQAS
jgi:phosphatidylinositol phospholipase C delta